jgi:hypothetical protein
MEWIRVASRELAALRMQNGPCRLPARRASLVRLLPANLQGPVRVREQSRTAPMTSGQALKRAPARRDTNSATTTDSRRSTLATVAIMSFGKVTDTTMETERGVGRGRARF